MSVPLPRRFTVDEYYRMTAAGVLGRDERVELIEGEVIAMAAIGSRHASAVAKLNRVFSRGVGDRGLIQVYREPNPAGYRDARTHRRGEIVHPLAFPDLDIAVHAIVP